jgi:hypothetical protein
VFRAVAEHLVSAKRRSGWLSNHNLRLRCDPRWKMIWVYGLFDRAANRISPTPQGTRLAVREKIATLVSQAEQELAAGEGQLLASWRLAFRRPSRNTCATADRAFWVSTRE